MLLYHGSPVIVEKPEIRTAKFHKDFYFGFYCTEMETDVFHCEPIEKVADDFIVRNAVKEGNYDPALEAKYSVPDYWDIGEVFQRLIEDTSDEEHVVEGIQKVFSSWIAERILNFNSDLFYQPREYIAECYKAGVIIPA